MRTRGSCFAALTASLLVAAAWGSPSHAAEPSPTAPRPVHVKLIYTGGDFSPVSVLWTTSSPLPRTEHGSRIDAGVGVKSNPSIRVSSFGTCYQGYASSYVVKRLRIGHRYPIVFAEGHGDREHRVTRMVTLTRASLTGTARHLRCHRPVARTKASKLTPDAAMRKGVRDVARTEGHHATASRVHVSCGKRGKIGHTARCTGSFRLTRHGRSATYALTRKAGVLNNSPGSLMYRVDSRADRKVKGLPSRTGLAGFLQ